MGCILSGYRVMGLFFNCPKCPPVNCTSQVTLHDVEPPGTGTVGRSCNFQLATHTVHNRVAVLVFGHCWHFRKPASSTDQYKLKAVS